MKQEMDEVVKSVDENYYVELGSKVHKDTGSDASG